MYDVDRDDYRLLNYDQYRLIVDDANRDRKATWFVSYQFLQFYQVSSMAPSNFALIVQRMKVPMRDAA